MRKSLALSLISAAALVAAWSTAIAGEQVLEYKIVIKPIDLKVTEIAGIVPGAFKNANLYNVKLVVTTP